MPVSYFHGYGYHKKKNENSKLQEIVCNMTSLILIS